MNYKLLIGFALIVSAIAAVTGCGLIGSDPPACNVLFISLDTLRADHLGCYGYDRPTSPVLDDLAEQSVLFEMAIAQAAVTPVSHASFLTGRNPYNHGVRVLHGKTENKLSPEQSTMAEIWSEAGGQTAAFISAFPVSAAFGLDQGFGHFDDNYPQADGRGLVTNRGTVNTGLSQRRADATTDAAIQWIENGYDSDKPLMMWVHYFDPHDTMVAPPREWMDEQLNGTFRPRANIQPDFLRAIYDCEINYMDTHIGRLLSAFKQHDLWDNTIIVVVADHGEGLGDHNWWSHGILYREQIQVPLIIKMPGGQAGTRVSNMVRGIDLAPTILAGAGVNCDRWSQMDGVSLVPTLTTGAPPGIDIAYSESVNILSYGRPDLPELKDKKDDKLYCLMTPSMKLIYHQLKPDNIEFYNLLADPGELTNLAALERTDEMRRLLRDLQVMDIFSELMPGMTATDLERTRKLKSLGYIQ
jgi:arylsulfatase A-like enzyme